MITASIKVRFDKGYIAHPYWPQVDRLIDIQKKSGMNRARSEANRRKALEEYLTTIGMTLDQYLQIEREAKRPFYVSNGKIIIPEHQVAAFMVSTCDTVRSASRPCSPDQVRSRFAFSDWQTDKTQPDGVWERFALVQSGVGAKLSNQRGLRRNEFIADFDATGTMEFDEEYVEPDQLRNALVYGGKFVGIGASRKMGWGRFALVSFKTTKN